MIFPEALESSDEFSEFRKKVGGPLVANMTEFGKTPYMKASEFERLGYNVVLFPVTAFRAAMKAVETVFKELKKKGTQRDLVPQLMTREEVYDLIDYYRYQDSDKGALAAAKRLRRVRP